MPTPTYDDDDVVEDYEVLGEQASKSGKKPGRPAAGGPVLRKQPSGSRQAPSRRPTEPQRPPAEEGEGEAYEAEPGQADPNKGKISSKAALQIWIICIAITVLGLGAVIADVIWDPLGRRGGGGQQASNKSGKANASKIPDKPRSPDEEKALAFKGVVDMERTRIKQKKPYKFFDAAYLNFRSKRSEAFGVRGDDKSTQEMRNKAFAEAIVACYEAAYAIRLVDYYYLKDADQDFMPTPKMHDMEELVGMVKGAKDSRVDILKEANVRYQAIRMTLDICAPDIKEFIASINKDAEIFNVTQNDKYKPLIKPVREKFEAASSTLEPKFDQKDLDSFKE